MANKGNAGKIPKLPTVEAWLLETPLYEKFKFNTDDGFYGLQYFDGTVDCYCEGCKRHSVFNCSKNQYKDPPFKYENYIFPLWFDCSRNNRHRIILVFWAQENTLQKIGQYPSLADLELPDLQKYRKILGDDRYRELARGIGLASHGVGIGAFIYLRRIFEGLIDKAHSVANNDTSWDEDQYIKSRMDERISLLKDFLPDFLVETRALYGILSKGVHELTEKECLEAFPVVKMGIELILDEELERLNRKTKIEAARGKISSLKGTIKHGES